MTTVKLRQIRRLKLERLVRADETERGAIDPEVRAEVEADLALLDQDRPATQSQ